MGIRMKARIALIAGAAMALAGTANAADIERVNANDGSTVIILSGDINVGDDDRFKLMVSGIPPTAVYLSSIGGMFVPGLQIAAMVHDRGDFTVVPAGEKCASVCGVIWLSGSSRFLSPSSKVGFHGVYNVRTGQQDGSANAVLGAYLSKIGLSIYAIDYATRADSLSMEWLSTADANRLGIKYTMLNMPDPGHDQEFGRTAAIAPSPPPVQPAPPAQPPALQSKTFPDARPVTTQTIAPDPDASVRTAAVEWLKAYFNYFNRPNGDIMGAIGNWYWRGDVSYYGNILPLDLVVADKLGFIERWPVRNYQIREGTAAVAHTNFGHSDDTLRVTGIIDWRARDPGRRRESIGSASFDFVLVPQINDVYGERGFLISEEDQKVLSRQVGAIDDRVCSYPTPPYSGPCGRLPASPSQGGMSVTATVNGAPQTNKYHWNTRPTAPLVATGR